MYINPSRKTIKANLDVYDKSISLDEDLRIMRRYGRLPWKVLKKIRHFIICGYVSIFPKPMREKLFHQTHLLSHVGHYYGTRMHWYDYIRFYLVTGKRWTTIEG